MPPQPRRNDPAVVRHQHVPGSHEVGDLAKNTVFNATGRPVQNE